MAVIDRKWDDAKNRARSQNHGNDWAFILEIYRQLGGTNQIIHCTSAELSIKFRLIGLLSDDVALILRDGELETIDRDITFRAKKKFSTAKEEFVDNEYELPELPEHPFSAYKNLTSITIRERK